MKRNFITCVVTFAVVFLATTFASAQLRLPQGSQKATVTQTIGVTDLTIIYFRPMVKGRTIWGDAPATAEKGEGTLDGQNDGTDGKPLVAYGRIWRTGANAATQFIVTDPVTINGSPLAAGSYSLHTIPGKEEWTIIFNTVAEQGGSFRYDAKKDALRVKTKPQWVTENQEALLFNIDPASANSAIVTIAWEKARIPFTVTLAGDVVATTLAKAKITVPAAKADDWATPYQAAGFANTNNDKTSATAWIAQALKAVDASIAAKETWQNLTARANILLSAGRRDDAFAAADKAIVFGKANNENTANFEKRFADLKAAKP